MKTIKNIAIHNTGGYQSSYFASTAHLTASDVDKAHRDRFNMLSSLNQWGGYNFFIDRTGYVTQFRAIGEETAAQKGHNFDTISICLAGNFSKSASTGMLVDIPPSVQTVSLRNLVIGIIEGKHSYVVAPDTNLALSFARIHPHRYYQPDTECYGSGLADSWCQELFKKYIDLKTRLLQMTLQLLYARLNALRFGSMERSCFDTDNRG